MHKQWVNVNTKFTKSFLFNIFDGVAGRSKMSNSTVFNRAYSTGHNNGNTDVNNVEDKLNGDNVNKDGVDTDKNHLSLAKSKSTIRFVKGTAKGKLSVDVNNKDNTVEKPAKIKLPELDDGYNVHSEVFEEIISILNKEFLEHRKIIGSKRQKIFKDVDLNEESSVETVEFKNSFKTLLINRGYLNQWARLDYNAKIKVLEIWWNEQINSSLDKRSEIFTEQSVFYKEINNILNLKN
nr:hypothetical protein [Grifola frondosa]